jgi:hypothetical protein
MIPKVKKRKELIRKNIKRKKIDAIKKEHLWDASYARNLAKEVLITECFIKRMQVESKKTIVAIVVERTGVPYIWSIKPSKYIKVETLKYPSYEDSVNYYRKDIEKMISKYDSKKTIFVFVDASRRPAMPGSFIGSDYGMPYKNSLKYFLTQTLKLSTKVIGYDRTMHDGTKKLPHYKDIQTNAILFNPIMERGKDVFFKNIRSRFEDISVGSSGAFHDDRPSLMGEDFKKLVLHHVNNSKKSYFKEKRE